MMSRHLLLSSNQAFHRHQWIRSISTQNASIKNVSNFNNFINADKFIIDRNPNAKRHQFFEKEIAGKMMVLEKSLPEDIESIIEFYVTHFCSNEVLTGTLKYTPDEAIELFTVLTKDTDTFMLRDGNEFVGMSTFKKFVINELPKDRFEGVKDYGKIIDDGSFKYRVNNILMTLVYACEARVFKKMVAPCTYMDNIMGGLHPRYFGQRIGESISQTCWNYCVEEGAQYYIGVSTSDASMKLKTKEPALEVIEKLSYETYLDHGKKPFENVIGGNKYAYPLLLDLKKYKKRSN